MNANSNITYCTEFTNTMYVQSMLNGLVHKEKKLGFSELF